MITVNGIDLRDLGFVASGRPQLPRLGGERTHVQPIPGRHGGIRMGGQVGDDTLSVTGHISAPDHATLLERIDLLTRVLQGRSVIRLSDYPDREWVGYLQQGPSRAAAIGPAWITRAENIVLSWTIPDPTARGQAEVVQPPGAVLLGTAPSPLRVEVQNGDAAPITKITVEAFRQELHNAGFEDSGPGYAPHWDESPSPNLLGPRADLEQTTGPGGRILIVGKGNNGYENAEPLAYYGLRPGDTISLRAELRALGGALNVRMYVAFYDAEGAALSTWNSPGVADDEWTPSIYASAVIPERADRWILRTAASGSEGDGHGIRNVMANLGNPMPYRRPSNAVYNPEKAYSGNRYAVLTATGPTRYMPHLDGTGQVRRWPVRAGDVVSFGAWIYRESADGTGYGRLHCMPYDDEGALQSTVGSPIVLNAAWTLSEGTYIVPEGIAWVGLRCLCNVGNGTTVTARFDDVYLRIRRTAEPQRIVEWNGNVAPGALWSCDAEMFQVLNGGANAIDGLTPASEFPVAEPGPGSYGYVLVSTAGGGDHQTTIHYRRRWL